MIRFLRLQIKKLLLGRIHAADLRRREGLSRFGELPPSHWGLQSQQGRLAAGGQFLGDLASEFDTPLYVVHRERLRRDFQAFRETFLRHYPKIDVGYSYKTNPLPGVLGELHKLDAGAEVISEFELWLARRLGVPPERIILNGPGKSRTSLEQAVDLGIKLINIDSWDEIELLDDISRRRGKTQSVALRVVTSVGWSSQFGVPLAGGEALRAFAKLRDCKHLDPCGVHIHLGTGLKEPATYFQAIEELLVLGRALEREHGIRLRCYDLGGGFGIPTVKSYSEWDTRLMLNDLPPTVHAGASCPPLEEYAKGIAERVLRYYPEPAGQPELVFEPGRAITSQAQMLLVRVLTIKESAAGKRIAIVDGGKNIAVPLGYEFHEILPVDKMAEPLSEIPYDVFGPLCHPDDRLLRRKRFPELQPGDVLAIMDAGAYFVPNQRNFSNPRPGAVMVDEGFKEVIRRPENYEDIVRLDPVIT